MKNKLGTEEAIKRWNKYAKLITSSYGENGDLHREIFLNPAIFTLMETVDQQL